MTPASGWMSLVFLFSLSPSLLLSLPPSAADDAVTVVCVGDIMLAHGLKELVARRGHAHPFKTTRRYLREGDVVFGNLEGPIAAAGDRYPDKLFHFLMDPPQAKALRAAGFRVVALANNHVLDFGDDALMDTFAALDGSGLARCGAGRDLEEARKPAVIEVRGRRVAFLAYSRTFPISFSAGPSSPGTAFAEDAWIAEDVAAARRGNDFVVVSFHWGEEYSDAPTPGQRRLARAAIDAGADAVVGSHPHVVQPIERYRDKIIAYSLGNYVFGTRNPRAGGILLKLVLASGRPPRAEVVPLLVDNTRLDFQPRRPPRAEALKQLAVLRRASRAMGTRVRIVRGRAVLP